MQQQNDDEKKIREQTRSWQDNTILWLCNCQNIYAPVNECLVEKWNSI